MSVETVSMVVGVVLGVIAIIIKCFRLKRKMLQVNNLGICIGIFFLSYFAGILIVQSIHLFILTLSNSLTVEIISENKLYLYPTWIVLALAGLITYISLIIEKPKRRKRKVSRTDEGAISSSKYKLDGHEVVK